MVKLSRADHLRMEANKKKKTVSENSVSVDFYDTDILEKTANIQSSDNQNSKPEKDKKDEEEKFDLEFHEQYFS